MNDDTLNHTKLRDLGPLERFFWASDQQNAKHFSVVAQFEGGTRVQDWREALNAVQFRHPLLRASITTDAQGHPFFTHVAGAKVELALLDYPPDAWETLLAQELAIPFDPSFGPLLRAKLLHNSTRATILLSAHHSIADGLSLSYLIRDLMLAMGKVELASYSTPEAQEDLVELPAYFALPSAPSHIDRAAPLQRTSEPPFVQRLKIDAPFIDQLRIRARNEGATVHGALVVALSVAGEQAEGPWARRPVTIKSPVDVRALIGRTDECALSIVSSESRLENLRASSFWVQARSLSHQVACAKTSQTVTGFALGLKALFESQSEIGAATEFLLNSGLVDVIVSNLGVLPFPNEIGDLRLEAMWGPAVFMGMEEEQSIGAITCGGALHLVHASYTPIKQLLGCMQKILVEACSQSCGAK